jgi:seryl-tRNA(Sec) selenium transferase
MTTTEPFRALAGLLAAEAAHGWRTLAGAVVTAAAACITGEDLGTVLRLPETGGRERRVVVQRGQVIELEGVSLLQLLRFAGAVPVEIGAARACPADALAAALAEGAAAGLLVATDAGEGGLVALAPFVWACREAGVPAVVIAGCPPMPLTALDAGADLVLFDAARIAGAPAAGLVVGRGGLVRASALQERGIGAHLRGDAETMAACASALAAAAADLAGGIAVPEPTVAVRPRDDRPRGEGSIVRPAPALSSAPTSSLVQDTGPAA